MDTTRENLQNVDAAIFGSEIRRARKAKGMTQADLAARVGISRATLIAHEQGHAGPSLDLAGQLANILGLRLTLQSVPEEKSDAVEAEFVPPCPVLGNMRHKRFPTLEEILWTTVGIV
jgi:putative transcriptional regulator